MMVRRPLALFAISFVCTTVVGAGLYFIPLLLRYKVIDYAIYAASFGALAYHLPNSVFRSHGPNLVADEEPTSVIPIAILLLIIVWLIPGLILYWVFQPRDVKKAVQIASFVVSSIGAIVFYLFNKASLPSVADKVGFFAGVCLSPPTALEFLL